MIIRQFLIRHGGQYFGFSNIFISSVKAGSRIAIIPSELRTRPFSSSVDESEFQARNFAEVTQVNELVQKVHSRTSSANKAHQNDGNLSIRENFEARNRHSMSCSSHSHSFTIIAKIFCRAHHWSSWKYSKPILQAHLSHYRSSTPF